MKRIVIVSGIQVIDNPRVVKEADALAGAGYDVEVLASIYDAPSWRRTELVMEGRRWRHTIIADFTKAPLDRVWLGAKGRLARLMKQRLGLEHYAQLGPMTGRLYRMARARNADLFIVHVDQELWAGARLLEEGRTVAADIEDWYSEDGLPQDRASRPIALMKASERALMTRAAFVTTTSNALAEALAEAYEAPVPTVVYNSFPRDERSKPDGRSLDRKDRSLPSVTWFSQTVGPGRGLEDLVAALGGLEAPCALHIRGKPRPGYVETLMEGASEALKSRTFFHPQAPQDELLSRIAEHDIGYCGELADCQSRNLTITNKAFEYMRAGLAVIASDTAGQLEVAAASPEAVLTFRQGDVAGLRAQLKTLVSDPARLTKAKAASSAALDAHFSWEASAARIQSLVHDCIGPAI